MSEFRDYPPVQNQPPASNNWKWILLICLLPIGALTCCCGGGAVLFLGAMSQVKSSETYTEAVRRAKADPRVQELLGEPITDGFSTQSNYVENNGVAEMTVQTPLTGPQGTATLSLKAGNQSGAWKYSQLEVRSAKGEVIDLRTEAEKTGE